MDEQRSAADARQPSGAEPERADPEADAAQLAGRYEVRTDRLRAGCRLDDAGLGLPGAPTRPPGECVAVGRLGLDGHVVARRGGYEAVELHRAAVERNAGVRDRSAPDLPDVAAPV